ncbi:diguanylate cyclase domain-containing protein [Neptuniibacter halophilus]|uniref:diguanylate cyclase domain-containing protein n=1 Tax=Neptuniibacter halophilus TaxID=651666 RepID=UPI00257484CF|nr:diguanylate cyclase [Neptuniibacter halophilus]
MEDFEQILFQRSPQAVFVTDQNNRIISANAAFEALTGYGFAEVAGEEPGILSADRSNDRFNSEIWLNLSNEGVWQGQIWCKRKDGTVFPGWFNIIREENTLGLLKGYLVQFFDLSMIQSELKPLTHQARYDELTQLPNWEMFQDILDKQIDRCREAKEQLAVMLVDLDRFKWINDNLGRSVGDNLLKEVARRLGSVVRGEDALARLSSDEFVMVLPSKDGVESAIKVAQRVVEQLSHGIFVDHREIFVSGSVGIALYPEHGEQSKQLVKKADVAMYAAKQGGRNTFRVYSELMERSKGPQILREEDLCKALVSSEVGMTFLPVYSIYSHRVVAVHARPSWAHQELGQIPLADFAALLQSSESLKLYEDWLDQELLSLSVIWERFPGLRFISFRLENQQLQSKESVQRWVAQLTQYQMAGQMMVDVDLQTALEREGALFDLLSSDALLSVSGFACESPLMEQLKEVQPDLIKLDADLVTTMSSDENRQKIIDSVLDMAERLEIEVLADGVASAGARGQLMGQGCMLMQGRYFGMPLSLEQLLQHLAVEH